MSCSRTISFVANPQLNGRIMSTNSELVPGESLAPARARHALRSLLVPVLAGRLCAISLVCLLGGAFSVANANDPPPWWESHWRLRLSLTVDVGPYERTCKPAEQYLNLKSLLAGIGRGAETCVLSSLRVVEVDPNGAVVDDSVPFQFDPLTDDLGNLVVMLTGTTPAESERYYHLYFDTTGEFAPADVNTLVELTDGVPDEGQSCYKIATADAIWYFQKDAGGFSSLLDSDGHDWIGFHPWGGSDGIYRGIPNLVHPDNIFHPGHQNCISSIVHVGPVKVTIRSVSRDDQWECLWEIYPAYARMTLLRKADKNYWFLYEGTPGGNLDLETDFSVRSHGLRLPVSVSWRNQDIPAPEWVYFEDSLLDRYIYLVHEEDDDRSDDFWQMQENMTVLGFGRTTNTSDKQLSAVPAHFTVGLADNAEFWAARRVIEGSYRPVIVALGPVEVRADFDGNGRVDAGDLAHQSDCWLKTVADRCDINQDQYVDFRDFALFGRAWDPNPELPGPLEGHWAFDEAEGSVAKDASGYGNHGAVVGATWATAGKVGSALEFDGAGDYVEVLGYAGVLGTAARTVTLWVNTSAQADMDVVSWGRAMAGASCTVSIMRGGGRGKPIGPIQLAVTGGSVTGITQLTDGRWHHVAAVLDERESPRVQDIRLYVDGQIEPATLVADSPVDTLAGGNVRLGTGVSDSARPFNGLLDEVRIYRCALTPEEITELAGITN